MGFLRWKFDHDLDFCERLLFFELLIKKKLQIKRSVSANVLPITAGKLEQTHGKSKLDTTVWVANICRSADTSAGVRKNTCKQVMSFAQRLNSSVECSTLKPPNRSSLKERRKSHVTTKEVLCSAYSSQAYCC